MKRLYLLRHAKSSWSNVDLIDVERPLNKRGRTNSDMMLPHMLATGWQPDTVYCSPAIRAQQTIENLKNSSEHHQIDKDIVSPWHVTLEPELYTFSIRQLLTWLMNLNSEHSSVTVVGHNPALNDLYDFLTGERIDNIPTCGFVGLNVAVDSWQELRPNCADKEFFLYPKMYTTK